MVLLLIGLGTILFLHQDMEGEVTTSASTIDAAQEEKEELAADDAEAAAALSAAAARKAAISSGDFRSFALALRAEPLGAIA